MQPVSRNQRPDLLTSMMNMSLVLPLSCEMHLSRASPNVPRLPWFLWMLHNPNVFAHFWQGAQSLTLATQNDAQMLIEHVVLLTFWLPNVLPARTTCTLSTSQHSLHFLTWKLARATTACTFLTSQIPKVLRDRRFLTLLTQNVLHATTACNFSSVIWPDLTFSSGFLPWLFFPSLLFICLYYIVGSLSSKLHSSIQPYHPMN